MRTPPYCGVHIALWNPLRVNRRIHELFNGYLSDGQAQRFLAVHGQVCNLFGLDRHWLRAVNARVLRSRAFADWRESVYAG